MAIFSLETVSGLRGAHGFGVLTPAFHLRELLLGRRHQSSSPQIAETSTPPACASRSLLRRLARFGAILLFCAALTTPAQDAPKSVRITFLPPPLDGTISLGIYDDTGKLVRVLFREAEFDDFTIGHDALATTWDGKSDAGEMLPPGKYHARGYAVGDVAIEGVGFFFNDWVTKDSSPRIKNISVIGMGNGLPILTVVIVPDRIVTLICNLDAGIETTSDQALPRTNCKAEADPPRIVEPIACDIGKDGTRWIVDRLGKNPAETEVKQFSPSGELLRRLTIVPTEPQPRQIAASKEADTILLLEDLNGVQRLRSLTLLAGANDGGHSDWKTDFAKKITAHKHFAVENGKPVVAGGIPLVEKLTTRLQANPLRNDHRENLDLFVGYDADGSFLKTADGLPLQSISDTRNLVRAGFGPRGENSVDLFQDDDAVVEQYQITGLDQMMAFDCGEIELK